MNFKTTLILLVLLAAVAVVLVIDRLRGPGDNKAPDNIEADAGGRKLFDFDPADITKLVIANTDGRRVVIAKVAKDWQMLEPVAAKAETWQVDSLVREIADLRSKFQLRSESGNGLDQPRMRVEIASKDGKTSTMSLGDKSVTGDLYVKVEGQTRPLVIAGDIFDKFDKAAEDLRDKKIFSAASTDISRISIALPNRKVVIAKNGSDWQMLEPQTMPVDESAASDLTSALSGLYATAFVKPDSAEGKRAAPGFQRPLATITFSTTAPATTQPTSAPAPLTLTFGGFETKDRVYVKATGVPEIAKIAATSLDTFTKKPLDLRDKKVVNIDPAQVSRLSVAIDVPATTQPTTKPADKRDVAIERRKEVKPLVAVAPPATQTASTGPAATKPSAAAKFELPPSTAPAKSPWEIKSQPQGLADESRITALLGDLHPMRADKYVEKSPVTQPSERKGTYTLRLRTEGPGGTPVTEYEITLTDRGSDLPVIGQYNGLVFEINRSFLKNLQGDYAKAAPSAAE